MGISQYKYAAHRGVSRQAVSKAVRSGRITVEADGSIDPAKADREWVAQTDPSQQRGEHAQRLAEVEAAATRAAGAAQETKPVPAAAIKAVDETLDEAGQAEGESGGSGEVSYLRAKLANEVLKAQTAKVRLQKMKGELVDRSRATAMVFDLARRERDAVLNWPPRVAANMAADLGVDPHLVEHTLDKYVRSLLAEMAEIKVVIR